MARSGDGKEWSSATGSFGVWGFAVVEGTQSVFGYGCVNLWMDWWMTEVNFDGGFDVSWERSERS